MTILNNSDLTSYIGMFIFILLIIGFIILFSKYLKHKHTKDEHKLFTIKQINNTYIITDYTKNGLEVNLYTWDEVLLYLKKLN